jgi:diguanylate cyclase (GGDEF)-like protein
MMKDLLSRRPIQAEVEVRPGVLVRVSISAMANGGSVVTLEDITEKRRNEERIAHLARHDALTGLPNRDTFHTCLERAVAGTTPQPSFAVLCLDLDHFKDVNDTLGHAAGDALLCQVTERLRHCVRVHDVVARLGGDEFAVLMVDIDGPAMAASLAERLIERISAPYDIEGHHIVIGTSIGIALAEADAVASDLLKRADVALYEAKKERGAFCFFACGMDEHLHLRRGLEADLRAALLRQEFELFYQPLLNLAENRISGFEALLRWCSDDRGTVAPADFIPLAEQTALILPIGEWVLRTACVEAARWPDDVKVAVNLSPVQFRNKHLVAHVRAALAESGLAPRRLELEITETVLLQDTEAVMSVLCQLHALGVRIAMDDFGTGYSSLSYLRRFPFDKIKIDRSFITDIRTLTHCTDCTAPCSPGCIESDSAGVIVRAIAGLGENLGIATTAEGVETEVQLAQLRHEGCTEVQGYYISPPRPAAEIAALLAKWNERTVEIATAAG